MQLHKLEIKGFKSFADKVVINFDEGVTGIVGPNGCGKSNVVDSIRWVLGEQKTTVLRSEKMENIIFNGTSNRSQHQMAEVSLTINNTKNILPTEYSQVTITRRLYRSGESEYLLNGVTCRLRDITDLFLDTGVASNSYAIIELGMVDDLLNDRDNSRRALFEEAAGISKFKKRKKETLKKLEDTDADLERVEDLLFEIEKNMKQLEKQAKQTELYYKLKEEYKEKSLLVASYLLARQMVTFHQLAKQLEEEQNKKVQQTAGIAEKEAELEKLKAESLVKEKTLSARQKSINDFVAQIRKSENEKQLKTERVRYITDRKSVIQQQLKTEKFNEEQALLSIENLKTDSEKNQVQFQTITDELQKLKNELTEQKSVNQTKQTTIDEAQQRLRQQQQELFHVKKEIEIRQIQIQSWLKESERIVTETHQQSESLVEFENKIKQVEAERNDKEAALQALKKREEENALSIAELEKSIEKVREELTQKSRTLDARENEFLLTKSLVDNLEGFPEAIKFLKKNTGWAKHAPLLSDIITTTDEYRIAIENYLEPYLNYYIVEHEAEAYQAINLLSEASKGKAHFFMLDAFKQQTHSTPSPMEGAVHALSIVEFDDKFAPLLHHLLGNVYVTAADTMQVPADEKHIYLTKSGKISRTRFSMSGGSVGLFEGKKIGRAKNLEKLEVEIKSLSEQVEQARQHLLDKQRELEKLKTTTIKRELEATQLAFRLSQEELISLQTKREQFSKMIDSSDVRRGDFEGKISTLKNELTSLEPKEVELTQAHKQTEEQCAQLAIEMNQLTEVASRLSQSVNEKQITFHQQENLLKNITREIQYKNESLELSKRKQEEGAKEWETITTEQTTLDNALKEIEAQLIQGYQEKDTLESNLTEAEKEYYAGRELIDKKDKELKSTLHEKEQTDETIARIHQQINDSKLSIHSVKERVQVEFQITLDEQQPQENSVPDDEVDKLKTSIDKIKEKMENMGPINPIAMEAYQEIKKRNDFIQAEKEDLLKSKESLFSTISEIEKIACDTFLQAFEKVKEHFIEVFHTLFNEGDDCDLRLVDPTRPLESDIDIIAKPKGKRPLTINQLSGGEKTLTATALLFSMYLLKPAPFCIFDEVDAPLDDVNVDKFGAIIRHFSKDSQFIIVTHNKRTMSSTDVIYGITMVEKGISRVVPVDMRELA